MWIKHPRHGWMPTYGGPYDSYTIPEPDEEGRFLQMRFDHDEGGWVIDEYEDCNFVVVAEEELFALREKAGEEV